MVSLTACRLLNVDSSVRQIVLYVTVVGGSNKRNVQVVREIARCC